MKDTIINRLRYPNAKVHNGKDPTNFAIRNQFFIQNGINYQRARQIATGCMMGVRALAFGAVTLLSALGIFNLIEEDQPQKKAIEQIIDAQDTTPKAALKNYLLVKPQVLDELLTEYENFQRMNGFMFNSEVNSNEANHVCLEQRVKPLPGKNDSVQLDNKTYTANKKLGENLSFYPSFNLLFDRDSHKLYHNATVSERFNKLRILQLEATDVSQVEAKSNVIYFVSGRSVFSRNSEGVTQIVTSPSKDDSLKDPLLKPIEGTGAFYIQYDTQNCISGLTNQINPAEFQRIRRYINILEGYNVKIYEKSKIKYHNGTIFVNSGNTLYCSPSLKNSQYKQIRTEGNITDFTFFDVNADGKDEIILASDGPLFEPGAIEVYRVDKKIFSLKHTTYGLSFPKPFKEQDAYFIHQKDFKTRILKKLQEETNATTN